MTIAIALAERRRDNPVSDEALPIRNPQFYDRNRDAPISTRRTYSIAAAA